MRSWGASAATIVLGIVFRVQVCHPESRFVHMGESIQEAIEQASTGDTVLVGPGRYNEAVNPNGKNVRLVSMNGPEQTFLDGTGLNGAIITAISGEAGEMVVAGFTFENGGDYHSSSPVLNGGAIHCFASAPTIRENVFRNNGNSIKWGGAIYYAGAGRQPNPILIENNLFISNSAAVNGGAISVGGACFVRNNQFFSNSTVEGDGSAIIMFAGGNMNIDGNVFRNNRAADHGTIVIINGGSVHVSPTEMRIMNNLIVSNSSHSGRPQDCSGSAIWANGGGYIAHNTILFNSTTTVGPLPGAAVCLVSPHPGSEVERNVIAFNDGVGIAFDRVNMFPSSTMLESNIVYGNTLGSVAFADGITANVNAG